MGDEPLYEIVEMDPLHKLREKGDDLEKEIDSIKKVLKDTVAVSKLHASADELVDKIIEMIKVSQDMVEAVAKSNQQISQQLQKSLDEMVRSNKDLSEKLNALLAFFAESSEAPSEAETTHPTGTSAKLESVLEALTSKLDEVSQTNKLVADQTSQMQGTMQEMSESMKTQIKKMRAPPMPSAPSGLSMQRPAIPTSPMPPSPPRPLSRPPGER